MKKLQKSPNAEVEETVVMRTVKKAVSASRKKSTGKQTEKSAPAAKKSVPHVAKPQAKDTQNSRESVPSADVAVAKKRVRRLKIDRKLKMTKTLQRHYRECLEKLREEYCAQMRFHQDDALITKKDANGERAGTATHLADLGSDTFRRDIELSMLNGESDVVHMIDIALKKLDNSEYGICAECGCAIPPARLEAKPYALYCTACKEKMEQREGASGHHR